MAEVLVSIVLKKLASLAFQQIEREWSLLSGIEEKVESLTSNLEDIQVVLLDADKRQIKEVSVKRWIDKLKAVSYEIDVVLDEWNTAIVLRSNLKVSSKVCFPTHPYFQRSHQAHRPGLRRRIACKIEKLNEKLDKISTEKERYIFSAQNLSRNTFGMTSTYSNIEYERRPNTTSFVDASQVYGREKEKDTLLKRLLSESSQAATRGPDIIPIVGMGGIGKTTVAQLVYNDKSVTTHFDLKLWVCVSNPFDELTIARSIAEALRVKDVHKFVDFQTFSESISEKIKNRKFLLVLDDVWTEDHRKWEPLEECLKIGGVGSKILVTTRKEEVAIMMKVPKDGIIPISYLSELVCLEIFNKLAFLDEDENEQLKKIGEEIAKKCRGLPLVAKALGSLMRFKKPTKEHWEEVLHSELWRLGDQFENEVLVPFLLSYYDLPPLEKCCLLYCSYFPKDYKISRDELIQLWMSQGYLSSTKGDERKGIDCFENLAKHSFFQDFEIDEAGNIITCKMHDIVHDFVLFLGKNEYLNTRVKTTEDGVKLLEAKAFHCSFLIESETHEVPTSIYSKRNLRTLSVGYSHSIRWDLLVKLTSLRTLNLSHCSFPQIPKNIDKLILLRYLNLSHNQELKKLPKAVGNLFNLQTLRLEGCKVKLPKEIEKLINLQHLYLGTENRPMNLKDLNKLNKLKGCLEISDIGRKRRDVYQAKRAQLNKKEHLVALVLKFRKHYSGRRRKTDSWLLNGLQPHPNLKHLVIEYYGGTRMSPSWMASLLNLRRLVLDSFYSCESLGPFGELPFLESLSIKNMWRVKRVGQEFLGIEDATGKMKNGSTIFPELKRLEFHYLPEWERWESCASSNGCRIMPCLVSLQLMFCDALKAPLPKFLQRTLLEDFTVSQCRFLEQHFQRQEELGTKDKVKILTQHDG